MRGRHSAAKLLRRSSPSLLAAPGVVDGGDVSQGSDVGDRVGDDQVTGGPGLGGRGDGETGGGGEMAMPVPTAHSMMPKRRLDEVIRCAHCYTGPSGWSKGSHQEKKGLSYGNLP